MSPAPSLYTWLQARVEAHPAVPALSSFFSPKAAASPQSWTFGELWAEINRSARLFQGLSQQSPLRLAVLLPPIPEALFAFWGGTATGQVLLLSPWQRDPDLLIQLQAFAPTVLLTTGPLPSWNLWERAERLRPQLPGLRYVLQVDLTTYLGTAARLGSRIALGSRKKAAKLPGQSLGDFNRSRFKLSDAPVAPGDAPLPSVDSRGQLQAWPQAAALADMLAGLPPLASPAGPVYLGQPLTMGAPLVLGPLDAWATGQPLWLGPAAPAADWVEQLPHSLPSPQPVRVLLNSLQLAQRLAGEKPLPPGCWLTEPPLPETRSQPGGWRWAYTPPGEVVPLLYSASPEHPLTLMPWAPTGGRSPEAVALGAGEQVENLGAERYQWLGRRAEGIYRRETPVWPYLLEQLALQDEQVWAAAAVPSPDPKVGEVPVLYLQWAAGEAPDLAAFFAWLSPQLPPQAQPAGIRLVDEMPALPSGEPDRLALARTELLAQAQQQLQKARLHAPLEAKPGNLPGHWVLEVASQETTAFALLATWLQPMPRIDLQPISSALF